MTFHLNIKFRAFGITFGTIDEKIPGAVTLSYVVKAVTPLLVKLVPALASVDVSGLLSQVSVPPHVVYDVHGVLLEVVSG